MSIEDETPPLPLRKKAKKVLLHIVQVVFAVISLILLLLIGVGMYLWLGNINDSTNLVGSGFLFILFLISSYIVHKTEEALREFRPSIKLSRNDIKQLVPVLLSIIAIIVLSYLLDIYLKLFPEKISAELTLEILKTLIQADGFLIGFSGIVFAQMFWAIHNQQAEVQKSILERPFVPTEKEAFDIREDYLTAFERKRKWMIILMFIVIVLFTVSILLSVSGMAQTETSTVLSTNPTITNPFWFMINGIIVFAGNIVQSKMEIREDVLLILRKRIKTQSETIRKLKKERERIEQESKKQLQDTKDNKQ